MAESPKPRCEFNMKGHAMVDACPKNYLTDMTIHIPPVPIIDILDLTDRVKVMEVGTMVAISHFGSILDVASHR